MRKTHPYILLALLISETAIGQVSPSETPAIYTKARFSLIVGPSLLSVRENEPYNQYGVPKVGFSAGIGIIKSLTSHMQLQGKMLFEKRGYKTSTPDTVYTTTNGWMFGKSIYNYHFDYLTFSIAPQFLIGKRKAISIGAGFYFGKLFRAKFQVINTSLNSNNSSPLPTDRYGKVDYGVTLNLGYSLVFGKKFLIALQLTENYGLKQLAPPPPEPPEKNNSLVFTVAISKK